MCASFVQRGRSQTRTLCQPPAPAHGPHMWVFPSQTPPLSVAPALLHASACRRLVGTQHTPNWPSLSSAVARTGLLTSLVWSVQVVCSLPPTRTLTPPPSETHAPMWSLPAGGMPSDSPFSTKCLPRSVLAHPSITAVVGSGVDALRSHTVPGRCVRATHDDVHPRPPGPLAAPTIA